MESKGKKQSSQGFTLAELLIVVAIIAVLVAVSIPIFTSRLEHSREVVCENNRKTLVHQIWYERMSDDSFTQEDANKLIKDSDAYCPSRGAEEDYDLTAFDEFIVTVSCPKHGGTASGGTESVLTTGQKFLSEFQDFLKTYSGSKQNHLIRTEFYSNFGNDPILTVNGKNYVIEPFYYTDPDSSATIEERTFLFAREDKGHTNNGWNVPFVYNVKEGKWYASLNYNGNIGSSNSINSYKDIDALNHAVHNEKQTNGRPKWTELTGYIESWDKD